MNEEIQELKARLDEIYEGMAEANQRLEETKQRTGGMVDMGAFEDLRVLTEEAFAISRRMRDIYLNQVSR